MPFLRDAQNRLIRKDGSIVEGAQKGRPRGRGKSKLVGHWISHLKVDKILGGAGPVRDEYERLLENPNTMIKDLQAWFTARGQYVNQTAINVHRHRHQEQFDKVRSASRMAEAFCEVVRKNGAGRFVEASQGRFEMMMMENLFKMTDAEKFEPKDWQAWGKALNEVRSSRQALEEMTINFERKANEATKAAESAANAGETGRQVVERMKEILGV